MNINTKYFTACEYKGAGWVRLFGYGIAWKDVSTHPMLFSERNGYVKTLRIGRWSFRLLNK